VLTIFKHRHIAKPKPLGVILDNTDLNNFLSMAFIRVRYLFPLAFFFFSSLLYGQQNDKVKSAIQLGDSWKFEEAIKLLEDEVQTNPNNADAHYWLARYCHYIVYDTRPFPMKSDTWSKTKILFNLKKAIELKLDFGDAHYFIAVEYGCRAREALKNNNIIQCKKELMEAKNNGGFPLFALEYAKNILSFCDKNAILFVDGDAESNAIMYLQIVDGFRKDISTVILSLLERPYYIKLLRDGIPDEIKSVPINWNDNLIMEMHNYLWKENTVSIPISNAKKREYDFTDTVNNFNLKVNPDYGGELLWNGTAAILNILENNKWERPIYCSLYGDNTLFEYTDYLKQEGFASKFMPYKVKDSANAYDIEKFETQMFDAKNYKYFNDIKTHNQPKAAYFFGDNRRDIILKYVSFLINKGEKNKAKNALEKMDLVMPKSVYPLSPELEKKYKAIEEQFRK